jgi:hypothetical protein
MSTPARESQCRRENAAASGIIFIRVVIGSAHDVLLIEDARRDGDMRWCAGGSEVRSGCGGNNLIHERMIVDVRPISNIKKCRPAVRHYDAN